MRRILVAVCVVAAGVVGAGCGGGGENGGPDGGTDGGSANPLACGTDVADVTAQQLYDGVIKDPSNTCLTCHSGTGSSGGGVVMDSVAALTMNVGKASAYATASSPIKVVEANRPENSTLYLKCAGGSNEGIKGPNGASVGPKMPVGAEPLSAAELKQVKDWICSGAD